MNNDDPTSGLFTVTCDACGSSFPAENRKCSCGAHKGQLALDIDKMLERVYDLDAKGEEAASIDVVFDTFWNLYDKFNIMNDIMAKADVSRMSGSLMVSFMVQTFKYIKQVPAHLDFCNRAETRMRETGYTEKEIHELVDNYRETGDYWESMAELGAPAWLSGPKPRD